MATSAIMTNASPSSAGSSPTSARGKSPIGEHSKEIQVDSAASSFSEDADTYSLDDLLTDYPTHFGRTYHKYKEGSYLWPNDDQEIYRMRFQFLLMKMAQGNCMFYAPVKNPRHVLEVGTGTGMWAIAVADQQFRDAKVTAVDLSTRGFDEVVPPNVYFEQQDCTDEDWARPRASIDFIYSQSMLGSLPDFKQYLINARTYLIPGTGYLECCEPDFYPYSDDNTIPQGWYLTRWAEWQEVAAERLGRPLRIAPKLKQWMIEAGYVDVTESVFKLPLGSWPADRTLKKLGQKFRTLFNETFSTASLFLFSQGLGWDRDRIEIFLAATRQALQMKGVHAYLNCHVVYGRRPTEEEEKKAGRMPPPPPKISSTPKG